MATEEQRTRDIATFHQGQLTNQGRQIANEEQRTRDLALYQLSNAEIAQQRERDRRTLFQQDEERVKLGEYIGGMGTRLVQRVGQEEAMPILAYGNNALIAMGYNPEQMVKRGEAKEIVKHVTSDPVLFTPPRS